MPLDPDTWLRVKVILDRARIQGLDPAEALEKAGLLVTPALQKAFRIQELEGLVTNLQNWRPAELLRRKFRNDRSCSPADMQLVIIDFIQEMIDGIKRS